MIGEVVRAAVPGSARETAALKEALGGVFDELFGGKPAAARWLQADNGIGWCPAVDVRETDEEIVVLADLPGVQKEDIQLEVRDRVLLLTGERKARGPESGWLRRELPGGRFFRAFGLSVDVKAAQVTASAKDGVLEIRLPKADEAKPQRVKVG